MTQTIPKSEIFNEDYFMRGREVGVSNYQNYTWQPEITLPCAERMAKFLGCADGDSILDYGCSRGFYVKALRMLGYSAFGFDVSKWAIENCDPEVKSFVSNRLPDREGSADWIICKDVLEHIPMEGGGLSNAINTFLRVAGKGVLVIVPLKSEHGNYFVAPQDNEDKTHVNCVSFDDWLNVFENHIFGNSKWAVQGGFRLPGVKQACDKYHRSVGFFTLRNCGVIKT